MRNSHLIAMFGLILSFLPQSKAIDITSLPDGTIIPMPTINYQGIGPQTFGPGITWTASNAFAKIG